MLEIRVHVRLKVIFNGQYTNIFKEKKTVMKIATEKQC